MKQKSIMCMLVFVCTLTLSACQPSKEMVSVTVYPIQYIVERLVGDTIRVRNISSDEVIQSAGIDTNYESTLEDSSILFYISGLEPYFDVYSDGIKESKVELIDLMSRDVHQTFQRIETSTTEGVSVVTELPYYEGTVFDIVDMYEEDPTFYVDPMAMIGAAETVYGVLVEVYPEHRATFEENLEILKLDLSTLDSKYQALNQLENEIKFVSMTPNFGTWQKIYGVDVYPVCLSKYGALPTNEQLSIIKQRIIDDGVMYIAKEDNLNEEMSELYVQLVEELGLIEIDLNNLSSIEEADQLENKDYLTLMYENLTSLEEMGK